MQGIHGLKCITLELPVNRPDTIDDTLANSEDETEMMHNVSFHQVLHFLLR